MRQPGQPNPSPIRVGRLRVYEANALQRILIELYGLCVGGLLYLMELLAVGYSRARLTGREHIPSESGAVFCCWHENIALVLMACFPSLRHRLAGRKTIWMIHPAWIFHGFNWLVYMNGISHVASGASGHRGKEVEEEIVSLVREGYSVVMLPDGPVPGPPRIAKKGTLRIALQAGVPILPIRFRVRGCVRLWGWDRAFYPLPFCRVDVEVGTPVKVTADTLETSLANITQAMG